LRVRDHCCRRRLRRLHGRRRPVPPEGNHHQQQGDCTHGERSCEEPRSDALSDDDRIRRRESELVDRRQALDRARHHQAAVQGHGDRRCYERNRSGRRPAFEWFGFGRWSRLYRRRRLIGKAAPPAEVIQRNDPKILDDLLRWRRLLEPDELELLDRRPRDAAVGLAVDVWSRKRSSCHGTPVPIIRRQTDSVKLVRRELGRHRSPRRASPAT